MIRVLIATGIFPPDIGGPATMLKSLAESLVSGGFEIKIITYSETCLKNKKEHYDYQIYRINKSSVFDLSKLVYLWQMRRLAEWADIIYATDTYSVGYFAYLLKRLFHKKYILRFTGDSAWEIARANSWTGDYILDFQSKKHEAHIEKLKQRRNKILFNADAIIVDSEFNKKLATKIGAREDKIKVIYNSVDFMNDIKVDQSIVSEIKNKYGKNNAKIIVTACRLTKWKGVDKIIQVLPELIKKNGQIIFLVLGDGNEIENLKLQISNLKLENRVHLLGKVNQSEIVNYFKVADVFILNSQYEGLSHTLLEVMRVGTPIVTTWSGGNPELIQDGENGLLVDYNNQQELLNAIIKILSDDRLAKKLVENAKEKVKKFRWSEVVEKTAEVIKSLDLGK